MPDRFQAGGLTWTDASLWTQFRAHCDEANALAAVDPSGRQWMRHDLLDEAQHLIGRLEELGLPPHARILVEARKDASTLVAALAISAVDGIFCPYSPKLGAGDLAVIESRIGHAAKLVGSDSGQPADMKLVHPDPAMAVSKDPRNSQTALIGFTSGTTGVPKAVMHGAASLNYATRACEMIAGLRPGMPILGIVPWDSAPGFAFNVHFALSQARPLIIVDPWGPVLALQRSEQYGCGWTMCVPTHLFGMIEAARRAEWSGRSLLKAIAVGGSSMTAKLINDAQAVLGVAALRMFGMSECLGHASTNPEDTLDRRLYSDGQSFPGTQDEAFGPDRKLLPRGQRGQAGVKGPSLFLGYCEGLGAGQEARTEDGYFLTGDEIVRDAAGYLTVVGRIKDQIIRGGFNIDPAELEAIIQTHPAVSEVAVVSVPEPRLGEQACAICTLRSEQVPPTLASILELFERKGVSKKKWPEHLVLVSAMPCTATGKIDKKALAEAARKVLAP